jgi:multicomponent Na+:H+ antiporter subunit D
VASILTLVSMTKIWTGIFWGEVYPPVPVERRGVLRWHRGMAAPAAVIIVGTLVIAACAGPIYRFSLDAATVLVDPSIYIRAVRNS